MGKRTHQEKEHFDSIATQYDVIWGYDKEVTKRKIEKKTKFLINACRIDSNSQVLEIGCGTGAYTSILQRTGASIFAVDISPKMIEVARRRGKQDNVLFGVADVMRLSFPDSFFDAVVGSFILHHLDLVPTLKEIKRVIKRGGRVAFCEPNMLNPQVFIVKNIGFLKRMQGDSPDETGFFKWQMAKLLREQGFTAISVKPVEFLHPATPEILIPVVEKLSNLLERTPFVKEIGGSLLISATCPR